MNTNAATFMSVFEQIGHTPCPSCEADRVMSAASSPNFRSEASLPTKSNGLIEAERKIKHYKTLLRIATDKLEDAVRRANEAAARATSAEMSAADALIKVSTAETAQHRLEIERLQTMQELERQRGLVEDTEVELRRMQNSVSRLEAENRTLRRSMEKVKDTKEHYANAYRELQVRQDGTRVLDIKRSFTEGQEEGWNEGRWYGYEEGERDGYNEGFKRGRKEGKREGRAEGKREERERALAAFDRFLAEQMEEGQDTASDVRSSLARG
ncbi:hypothetical protein AX15_006814 [Amanita polypyramis BW_CC]|nr:hypothetical protein AX15_006814 [Amanita polypyramis BW_CC]